MPDPLILLCGPALDAEESKASLAVLRELDLPGATRFLVTTGKFDAEGEAKTVNVEADYPADTAYLHTLRTWAETGQTDDPRFRDGYDLYCLRRILKRFTKFDFAVLLRGGARRLQNQWEELQHKAEAGLYVTFDERLPANGIASPRPSLVINLKDGRSPAFLEAAWELYRTGAVYGAEAYGLDAMLSVALDAVGLEQDFARPSQLGESDLAGPEETLDAAARRHTPTGAA